MRPSAPVGPSGGPDVPAAMVQVLVGGDFQGKFWRIPLSTAQFRGAKGSFDVAASTAVFLASDLLDEETPLDDLDHLAVFRAVAHLVERIYRPRGTWSLRSRRTPDRSCRVRRAQGLIRRWGGPSVAPVCVASGGASACRWSASRSFCQTAGAEGG